MKIVHALGWYFPEALGGTEIYVDGLAQRLKGRGHHVRVAAPQRGLDSVREYVHQGIPVFRYPLYGEDATRDECQARVPTRGNELFLSWIAKDPPDLLHVHTLLPGLGIHEIEAVRSLGVRVVVTSHLADLGYVCQRGTLMRWGRYLCDGKARVLKCTACSLQAVGLPQAFSYPAAAVSALLPASVHRLGGPAGTALAMADLIRYRQQLQQRLLKAIDALVLLNQGAHDRVLLNGAPYERLFVNHLGVSSRIVRKPSPDNSPTQLPVRFGYVGRYAKIKGVIELARAWRRLPPDLPATLQWVGPVNDEEARNLLAQLKAMLKDNHRVRFAEAVPASDIGTIMRALDVLLVPSRWFENGPTVVHEAFAAGTPVVGTRVGAMPELIRDQIDGRLLTPGDVSELATAIQAIASDPAGTVDQWRRVLPMPRTMDDIASDYERLYLAILNNKSLHLPAKAKGCVPRWLQLDSMRKPGDL